MRLAYGFLGLSLAGLCGAVAVPQQQQDQKAENVFQNITSFKGSKASDIIPAMHFMSSSLGVGCDYCHTQDRASDSKRPKQTAREMIAMQRDINAKNFRGRNQVTCATCHAGHEHPLAVPPVEGLEVRARRSDTVKPDEVLAAYGKAVGMGSTVPAGFEVKGIQTAQKTNTQVEVVYSGSKFKLTTKTPKGDVRQGFDGTMAWFTTDKGIQSVPLAYAATYVNMWNLYTGPESLPKLSNPSGGTASIDGKDMLVVSGTSDDEVRVGLYFDKKSGLLARVSFSYPSVLGNTTQINDYSDYRKVGGVMIPTTVASHSPGADTVTKFRSTKADTTVDAAVFQAPKS